MQKLVAGFGLSAEHRDVHKTGPVHPFPLLRSDPLTYRESELTERRAVRQVAQFRIAGKISAENNAVK